MRMAPFHPGLPPKLNPAIVFADLSTMPIGSFDVHLSLPIADPVECAAGFASTYSASAAVVDLVRTALRMIS